MRFVGGDGEDFFGRAADGTGVEVDLETFYLKVLVGIYCNDISFFWSGLPSTWCT